MRFDAELRWFRKHALKISRTDLGRLLRISKKMVGRLERGQQRPTQRQKNILMRLASLTGKLNPVNGKSSFKNKEGYHKWLERSLPALENFRPVDCLESKGKFQKLLSILKEIGLS